MEDQLQDLIFKIQKIKSRSGRIRYPESLKRDVVALYRASQGRMKLLGQLGIGRATVAKWVKTDAVPLRLSESVFKSVSVSPTSLPRLVLINGISVENLSEEFILKVLAYAFSTR